MNISYNIIDDILTYFVRSGYVDLPITAGTLRLVNFDGRYWSSYSNTANSANSLLLNSTSIFPSPSYDQYRGYPLRCLSTVLGM